MEIVIHKFWQDLISIMQHLHIKIYYLNLQDQSHYVIYKFITILVLHFGNIFECRCVRRQFVTTFLWSTIQNYFRNVILHHD